MEMEEVLWKILKDSYLEKVLLCRIEDNLVVVHLVSYKKKKISLSYQRLSLNDIKSNSS